LQSSESKSSYSGQTATGGHLICGQVGFSHFGQTGFDASAHASLVSILSIWIPKSMLWYMMYPMRKYTIHFILLFCLGACKNETVNIPPPFYPCEEKTFWEAVKMAESGGKPNTCYKESDGTLSCGWFQLSLTDAKIYGCRFEITQDMFDPGKNTDCKNKIAAKLRSKYPTEPWDIALARYWGTMRSRNNSYWSEYFKKYPNHNGYANLQREAKKLNCIIK
jgi:hypothetical protein